MEYITVREAAEKWGVSERRIGQYCTEGRIPGAERFGGSWAIAWPDTMPAGSAGDFAGQRCGCYAVDFHIAAPFHVAFPQTSLDSIPPRTTHLPL